VTRDPIPPTVAWRHGRVRLIDQRALPHRLRFIECATVAELRGAIVDLTVRGAPALGATGAYGVALAARTLRTPHAVHAAATRLRAARPTAVNLSHGIDHALTAYDGEGAPAALAAARAYAAADVATNRALSQLGAALVPDGARVLTHCNAGSLACVGYGTALGVIRAAAEQGHVASVWVDETRPVLQGARLTAWELARLRIPHTLVADAAAGGLMARGLVDFVVVGADRVAANGDVANKVGTYPLAVLARRHRIPFVVAAPTSTIDLATPDGTAIVVEDRDADEVTNVGGARVAPSATRAENPAFDVTPAALVDALVTEWGVVERPGRRALARLVRGAAAGRGEKRVGPE
jgi:methylthioribose-1-phosphate isomerase